MQSRAAADWHFPTCSKKGSREGHPLCTSMFTSMHSILRPCIRTFCNQASPRTWATITELAVLSPTTRKLRLKLDESACFSFQPGQWVDFFIPGSPHIGGYSITSLPSELPFVDLAVKAAAHPPAAWCTSQAATGDRVQLSVGGTFALHEADAALFVAAGVGITPLYSMMRSVCARADASSAALIYSARTKEEILFASELRALAEAHPSRVRVWLHTTREAPSPAPVDATAGTVGLVYGRVSEADLEAALRWLGVEPLAVLEGVRGVPWQPESKARARGTATFATPATGAYVCGPSTMTLETVGALKRMGVPAYSEQWW